MKRLFLFLMVCSNCLSASADFSCSNKVIRGPQGPAGPTGPRGPTGDRGDMGVAGRNGRHGIQGVQGAQGPQGCTGPRGLMGCTGDMGPTGPRGNTGPTGATGLTGMMGDTGVCPNPVVVYAVYSFFRGGTTLTDGQISLGSTPPIQKSSGWVADSNGSVRIPEEGYYEITWIVNASEFDLTDSILVELRKQGSGEVGFSVVPNTQIGITPNLDNDTRHIVGMAILPLSADDQIALYNISDSTLTYVGGLAPVQSAYTLKLIKIAEL